MAIDNMHPTRDYIMPSTAVLRQAGALLRRDITAMASFERRQAENGGLLDLAAWLEKVAGSGEGCRYIKLA